jgi:hypothetical protein
MKYSSAFTVALLLVFTGSACAFSLPRSANTPAVQPIQITQVVTREVTQVIEIPVTVTPTLTPLYTFTPSATPSITSTPGLPVVTILEYTDCLNGPASFYLYKTSLPADALMEVVGRSQEGSWFYVEEVNGWNPCWVQAAQARFNIGDASNIPFVYSTLPYSNQYWPPNAVARREGNEVTISWPAVWMSLDDYRGYLIEAWVCQDGTQVFLPISIFPPLANNTGTLSVKTTDESGCDLPSSAHIYSADKYGYSTGQKIFWPPY